MSKILKIVGIVSLVVIIVGLGISVASINSKGTAYLSESETCSIFPSGTSFKAEKQVLSQWHWTYKFTDIDAEISMSCPAANRDADIYVGNKLVARSDIKTFSILSKNYIHDCHGNIIYVSRTADGLESLINLNGFDVSFELWDAEEKNLLGYIDGKHFFDDDFDIKNSDGVTVAHMTRHVLTVPWYWEFTIYDTTSPISDMRVLSMIAGNRAFAKVDKNDHGDGCNKYFWGVGITILVIVCIIGLIVLLIVAYCCYLIYTEGANKFFLDLWKEIINKFSTKDSTQNETV